VRLARAVGAIREGGFTIRSPGVMAVGFSNHMGVWFAAKGDGRCGGADGVFVDLSAQVVALRLRVPDRFIAGGCGELVDDWPDE
jgi:hypothetical protein